VGPDNAESKSLRAEDTRVSVMRSRGVSVSIILQNLAQLKALFEKSWESIVGNCDEFVYLGGNEFSTHKYVSELLGKETIDTNSYGRSDGMRGNFSTNFQVAGRELLTPDEVRMLDNKYAIVFIRGEKPVVDFKYNIFTHPNVHLGADGGVEPYTHTIPVLEDVTGIEIVNISDYKGKKFEDFPKAEEYFANIYAYDDEETEALCDYLEKKNEKREENAE